MYAENERTVKMDIQISQETCCKCNMIYWITTAHQKQLISCKNTFYCPAGHPQSYKGNTNAQKIENLERELRCERRDYERLARSNSALRGVVTRNKKKNP